MNVAENKSYYYYVDTETLKIESGELESDGFGWCGCMQECDCDESARYNEDGFECVNAESLVSLETARDHALKECRRLRDLFDKCIEAILLEKESQG
jgi:hypothetical protein